MALDLRGAFPDCRIWGITLRREEGSRMVECVSSSSSDARPETSISSSELAMSKGSRGPRLRRWGKRAWSCAVENVLRDGACLLLLGCGFGADFAVRKLGEWVRDGGEEIGESCVSGGGVRSRRRRRHRGGSRSARRRWAAL